MIRTRDKTAKAFSRYSSRDRMVSSSADEVAEGRTLAEQPMFEANMIPLLIDLGNCFILNTGSDIRI